jgi:RND family efflux transporter MFP subunit
VPQLGRTLGGIVSCGLLAGVAAYAVHAARDDTAATSSPAVAPSLVTVANPLVQPIVEWTEYTGRFEAAASVEIRARVAGYLQSIKFADGQIVKEGDILFVIDPRPFQAAVAQAEGQLVRARAQAVLSGEELNRARRLVGNSTISQSVYEQRVQQKEDADATVKIAEATLQTARLDLEFSQVRAPITGRVSDRRADVGSLITSDTLLTTIVTVDPVHLVFDLSESQFVALEGALANGDGGSARDRDLTLYARLANEQGWPRKGVVDFVDNRLNEGSGTIRLRAVFENSDRLLTPGQFARVRLPASDEYAAMLIPETAIAVDQANRIVMVVNADDTVEPRIVKIGPSYPGGLRIVRGGLQSSDRLVINGLMRIRPGSKVSPQIVAIAPDQTAAEAACP